MTGESHENTLERFTERKDISGWAREAAFKAMVALVLWGKVPRENVVTVGRNEPCPCGRRKQPKQE